MKLTHKIAIAYGLSFVAFGAFGYYMSTRSEEGGSLQPLKILKTAATGGLVVGTGVSVLLWLSALNDDRAGVTSTPTLDLMDGAFAVANGATRIGNLSHKALNLLSQVDAPKLFAPMRENGVKVAPVPDDPYTVDLEA